MARFVGTAINRLTGNQGNQGFTRAAIFTTPGTTTFDIPPLSPSVKVFAIGAGSDYTAMTFCHNSNSCCSGVASLGCCYNMTYTGHNMGAGGGYTEKTWTNNPGGTASITVGQKAASVGGSPVATSVTLGGSTITAYSAYQVDATWNCTGNSTARNSTYDNQNSLGLQVPTCGNYNYISGYWQVAGGASGGDVNRTGGSGVVIPEFINDSAIYPVSAPAAPAGGSSGSWCVYSKALVDSTFGFYCYCCYFTITPPGGSSGSSASCGITPKVGTILFPGTGSQRTNLQTAGSISGPLLPGSICPSGGSGATPGSTFECGSSSFDFYYGGRGCWCMCAMACGGSSGGTASPATIQYDPSFRQYSNRPIGIGATSGLSEKDGLKAKPEAYTVTPIFDGVSAVGGGGGTTLAGYTSCSSGTFGSCDCWLQVRICNCCWCPYFSFSPVGGGGSGFTPQPYYDITYIQTEASLSELRGGTLNLSGLLDNNGNNIPNLRYGQGAGAGAATYGGGGNRCYPAANGAVVIIY